MQSPLAWLRRVRSHVALLRHDPEAFAANLLQLTHPQRYQQKLLDMLSAPALAWRLAPSLQHRPTLNVLLPGLAPALLTGGPNTVLILAHTVARCGVPVRIVTADTQDATDQSWLWQHLCRLTGEERPAGLSVATAGDLQRPLAIGVRDMFLATHWTTAQQLRVLLPRMATPRFFYLIQDYEPGFYPWSSNYALALQTYGMDHIGVFNERFLLDYFVGQGVGLYAEAEYAAQALVFEPAIDRALFRPPDANGARSAGPRRLLFYARPGNPRNLLGLGLAALRAAVRQPAFQHEPWEFLAIGSAGLPPLPLGQGHVLQPAPWADYTRYAELLRTSDILLCPMLSPHTSYPVLEMAGCGGIAVTNSFATKTTARLRAISANIIAAPATETGLQQALVEAAVRVRHGVDAAAPLHLPPHWHAALGDTAQRMANTFRQTVPA